MRLNLYLKNRGVVSGPRSKSKNTSHSALDVILKHLTNKEQFKGGEGFLLFGNGLHSKFLINTDNKGLTLVEIKKIKVMVAKLWSHPVVRALMLKAICEKKKKGVLNGVKVAYVLDINQKHLRRGADLKTTVCKSMEEFVEKAIEYGYFRQGETYKVAEGLKDFIFIGIQKIPPYSIFILDVSLYPEETRYSMQELEFLLYFYQNYGVVLKSGMDLRATKTMDMMEAARIQLKLPPFVQSVPDAKKKFIPIKNLKPKTKWQRN